ncbi:SH2 domain-containing protein 4A [Channa argus]|uniref:SH2 domain-containing protein 4A n=1 Tax=Channa argus TaxID=215402 RepID=A0A6G1QWA0_CHAAH|nr:SH2 domain-containing protein 4A [Channa argus]KAK2879609.1 hypothetical protein Q8A73_023421 [Channa argus]
MLQQILTDMYIDPDVLNALNEDQKKTLFLKMRQEQVRRWNEREEKLEREAGGAECKRTKPKKANNKSVSWLLGRDGDVAVIVIGEVDELSSKFICSGFGEKKPQSLQNSAYLQTILKSRKPTEPVRTETENLPPQTQPGISLSLKGKCEEKSTSLPLPPELKSPSLTEEEKSIPQSSICSRTPLKAAPFIVRPSSANVATGSTNQRSEIPRLVTATPSASLSNAVTTDCEAMTVLQSEEPQKSQESHSGKDIGASVSVSAASEETGSAGSTSTWAGRGRVAQLMKTFNAETTATPSQTPSRGIKPPLPTKPSHLRLAATPTVR